MGHVKNYYWDQIMEDQNKQDEHDIRLEFALEYLKMCGYKIVDAAAIIEEQGGVDGGFIFEANNGNFYRHTYQECIDFYETGGLPEEAE